MAHCDEVGLSRRFQGRAWASWFCRSKTTPRGFEPLRAEPNGFRVHLLNRSDTVSLLRPRVLALGVVLTNVSFDRDADMLIPQAQFFGRGAYVVSF